MNATAPCAALRRPDKWYLGGGRRLIWTPPHPEWLDTPGFWDPAHYYDRPLGPLFTATLLDTDGRLLPCRPDGAPDWQPHRLKRSYATDAPLSVTERRCVLPDDVITSHLTLHNRSDTSRVVHLVQWTLQAAGPGTDRSRVVTATPEIRHSDDGHADSDYIRLVKRLQEKDRTPLEVECAMGLATGPDTEATAASVALQPSESGPMQPHWRYTPFYETFSEGFGGSPEAQPDLEADRLYAAAHIRLVVPPEGTAEATLGFTAASDRAPARRQLWAGLDDPAPATTSQEAWNDFFDGVPRFSCSDDHLETYYQYRWYGLNLFRAEPDEGLYAHPAVYEGPEYFRKLITYSAQCHLLETRWMDDPALSRGSLLNFIANQRTDGGFYGHVFARSVQENSFYHANWGHVWALHQTHPDDDFLATAYDGLSDYVTYFDRERDPEDSGLYDIWNHYETGQEYMHRYQAVSQAADQIHWGQNFRLKGVDVAVQLYQTKRALAKMAGVLGRDAEAERWAASADRTRDAVRTHMWDPDRELFFDVDPRSGDQTGVKAAVCFYPYFTDIVTEEHLPGLKRHLFDPDTFWTPYPVPSSSQDDPYFSATPHWKGERKNCPWNGRTWPMTNSHVAEAIAQAALRFDDDALRERAATFITRFVRMLFADGDPDRPECFEHYNPLTGQAARYRGINDYQHSWVVELIIKYVAGLRPQDNMVVVDPFPFDLDRLRLRDVPVRDHRVGVAIEDDRVRAFVDGEVAETAPLGTALQLSV